MFLSRWAGGFLTFPPLFTIGLGFLLMGCTSVEGFLVRCIPACTFACSFLPIAPDSLLVPTVSGRVSGFLAGGRWDGLWVEVVGRIPRGGRPLYLVSFFA